MRAKTSYLYVICAITALFSASIGFSFADEESVNDPNQIFNEGNRLYKEAKFAEAIAEYEKLVEGGFESGNLFYNLGNSYFKINKLGKAILNYERSKKLMPRDSDLKSNYKYALSLVEHTSEHLPKMVPVLFMEKFSGNFTTNELTIILSVLFLFAIAIFIAGLYTSWARRQKFIILSLCILFFALGTIALIMKIRDSGNAAIIVEDVVESKFEPFERATTYYKLYEGTKVIILEIKREWCKIKREDGKIAWIKKATIERI